MIGPDCALTYLGRPSSRQEALERLTVAETDPETNAVVAVAQDGSIVGFGTVWTGGQGEIKCFARVAPEMIGKGVGTTLLDRLERRARELIVESDKADHSVLTVTQWAKDTAGQGLLRARGYSEARFFLRMITDDLELGRRDAPLPAGIVMRSLQPGDDEEDLYDAWREAFADNGASRTWVWTNGGASDVTSTPPRSIRLSGLSRSRSESSVS